MTTFSGQLPGQDGGTTRIAVDVTFLRLNRPSPIADAVVLPAGCTLATVAAPSIGFYRYLYNTVGQSYCWWLRRMTPDAEIGQLLADPAISLHVLYRHGEPAGFFELDGRGGQDVNLSYFGLVPHAIGNGLGAMLLAAAVAEAKVRSGNGAVRVNTCTADHPRALPNYLAAGFRPLRTVREVWDIPNRLGLPIPARLRA